MEKNEKTILLTCDLNIKHNILTSNEISRYRVIPVENSYLLAKELNSTNGHETIYVPKIDQTRMEHEIELLKFKQIRNLRLLDLPLF